MDEDKDWRDLALCQHMNDPVPGAEPHKHVDRFAEAYEEDSVLAETMDQICLSCPVRNICLSQGVENREYGLWGGVFLSSGKPDKQRNAHKTEAVWEQIRSGLQ